MQINVKYEHTSSISLQWARVLMREGFRVERQGWVHRLPWNEVMQCTYTVIVDVDDVQ